MDLPLLDEPLDLLQLHLQLRHPLRQPGDGLLRLQRPLGEPGPRDGERVVVGHARLEEGHGEGGGEGCQAGADGRSVVPDAGPDEPARPGQGKVGAEPVQALGDLVAGDLRKREIRLCINSHH